MSQEHRIAVISDTHDLLRPEVVCRLKTCEVILHGGDISGQNVLRELEALAPIHVVRGNADKEWAEYIPDHLELELFGKHIFMTHKKKDIPVDVKANIVICGHSHKYAETYEQGILYLNPGSCGPRRFNQPITMAVLTVGDDGIAVEKIEIAHTDLIRAETIARVTTGVVEEVCRQVDRGKSVQDIAKKYKLDEKLAEQIVRMYLTHPGVTAERIMTKLGL